MWQDKELLWFPLLQFVALLGMVVGISFALIRLGFLSNQAPTDPGTTIAGWIIVFLFYLVTAFVTTFFAVCMAAIGYARLNGRDLTFLDGVHEAWIRIDKIFIWALLSATVGVLLKLLSERSKVLGKVAAWLGGTAWAIATFFIIPILLLKEESVLEAVRDSGRTFKKIWGESVVLFVSTNFFFGVLAFVAIGAWFGIVILMGERLEVITFLLSVTILFIILAFLTALSTALDVIFKVALYTYAESGVMPQAFSPALLEGAVRKK